MKERHPVRVADDTHSHTARIALTNQRNRKSTYRRPAGNWFKRQFHLAAESSNSINGESVIRLVDSDKLARLAQGSKVAQLYPSTIFTRPECVCNERPDKNQRWIVGVLRPVVRARVRSRRLKLEWLNN